MNTTIGRYNLLVPITLMLSMALTRFDHFGSALSLPDASLAVFFLAGLGFNKPQFFLLLLVEAGLIDYFAITQFGVSDFCISPAYVCLIPTYAVMWLAGHYCKRYEALQFVDSLKSFGLAIIATTVAFIISNGSFYLWSGSFGELSWYKYLIQMAHYLPSYLSASLIYIVIGLAIVKLMKLTQSIAVVKPENDLSNT